MFNCFADHSKLAILLYDCGVSLRKVERVLGWIDIERSHVAIWTGVQKFGQWLSEAGRRPTADLPAVVLLDETVVKQQEQEFTLFAAVDPETRHLLHASVVPSRNTLTTRGFFTELAELCGRVPPIVVTDDGASYGPVFTNLGVTRIVHRYSVRNRIERGCSNSNAASTRSTPRSLVTMLSPRTTGSVNSAGSGTRA